MKDKIQSLIQNLKIWIDENKKTVFIFLSIVIVLLIILIIILITHDNKKEQNLFENNSNEFILKNDFVIPSEPGFTEDFYLSREKQEKWSNDEVNKYFTDPKDGLLKNLRSENDKLSQKILEAVP
ncbi:MAG: hypothetical protein GX220_07910 [Treponema sp.]|nr:hypothetical protein [Treponema sp.]